MNLSQTQADQSLEPQPVWVLLTVLALLALLPGPARAIPAVNRQTGQNCVACHAGGQFPELTPYGRLFKLTGYTIGQRAVPISAMAVLSWWWWSWKSSGTEYFCKESWY